MRYVGLLDRNADGAFGVVFPDCPGCVAMGGDESEAVANASEALAEWLADLAPDRRPAPRSEDELRRDEDVSEQLRDGAVFALVPVQENASRGR